MGGFLEPSFLRGLLEFDEQIVHGLESFPYGTMPALCARFTGVALHSLRKDVKRLQEVVEALQFSPVRGVQEIFRQVTVNRITFGLLPARLIELDGAAQFECWDKPVLRQQKRPVEADDGNLPRLIIM